MRSGVVFNRKMGFGSIELFGLILMLVWGWRGNCYGPNARVLRIDLKNMFGKPAFSIQYVSNYKTTTIWVRHLIRWRWNSEHLAMKFGTHHCPDFGDSWPEHWRLDSKWLGHHMYV